MKEIVSKMDLDMLENVSGGVVREMSENTELKVNEILGDLKKEYPDKSEFIVHVNKNYDGLFGFAKDEMTTSKLEKYIDTNWPLL